MVKDYDGYLNDSGWTLAQDWNLDDLVAHPDGQNRQDRFAGDVHTFLKAGEPEATPVNGQEATSGDREGSTGIPASGKPGPESAPFNPGMATGIQAFLKAGQAAGGGYGMTPVLLKADASGQSQTPGAAGNQNGPAAGAAGDQSGGGQGQSQEGIRGPVGNEIRGPIGYPGATQGGAEAQRGNWEKLKGIDQETKDYQKEQERRDQERETWEKMKGVDPETHTMLHGPNSPVANEHFVITSPYGDRKEPYGKHHGIDTRNPLGADVYASQSGTVSYIGRGRKYGENYITVKNKDGSTSTYSHTTPNVNVGQRVYSRDVLGITDMSGRTNGPHLHYQTTDEFGKEIDPSTKLPKRQ